jgi:EmrB/QacA subfamily drug resistance transporter
VSWRAIFFLNLPVAAGAVAVTLFAAHESRDETVERRIDFPGVATLTVGLTALVLALIEGNSWGWDSAGIVGLFALAVVGLTTFVLVERSVRAPMVDFSFFRSRSFLGANVVAFVVSFAMLAMFFFLALYMQNILGYSPLQAGVRFLPSTIVIMFMGPLAGRLTDRIGPRPLIVTGLLIVSASMLWQSQVEVDTGYTYLLPAFVAMGFGIALVMSPMSTAAMNAVDPAKAGVASGTLSMSRMVGGTFGVAAIGALVAALGRSKLEELLPALTSGQREHLVDALGGGGGASAANPAVADAMREAFVHALHYGLLLSSVVAFLGAIVAGILLGGRPEHVPAQDTAVDAASATPAADEATGTLVRA